MKSLMKYKVNLGFPIQLLLKSIEYLLKMPHIILHFLEIWGKSILTIKKSIVDLSIEYG